jgi:hypothetical protein
MSIGPSLSSGHSDSLVAVVLTHGAPSRASSDLEITSCAVVMTIGLAGAAVTARLATDADAEAAGTVEKERLIGPEPAVPVESAHAARLAREIKPRAEVTRIEAFIDVLLKLVKRGP